MSDTIALSLVSHTNVGKTALARTLLGRDVGEIRDAPHVTTDVERHPLLDTAQGDVLYLWDTPGFGDSARLALRLAGFGNPIARFLAMAWDRWRDRAFWSSQQAVQNVRDEADVVLYLVNASESPADTGYLAPELQILEWIGKPVIALLNQTGRRRTALEEAADIARWRDALGERTIVRGVLALDAFARCWVQETVLLREVTRALPEAKRAAFSRLAAAWQDERAAQFDAAMDAIAAPIARAAVDRVALEEASPAASWRSVGKAIGLAGDDVDRVRDAAMRTLSERLDADLRASTDRLIAIHRLGGRAAADVTARLAADVTLESPVDTRKAAVIGGLVSGALTGLAADLAAGGLTFGAGLLAGGVAGAFGAAGLARGFNLARGRTGASLRWSDEFVAALVPAAVLRYLAVAHYGRGRGDFAASENPAYWREAVASAVARQGSLAPLIALRDGHGVDGAMLAEALERRLADISLAVLETLYPGAGASALPSSRRSAENCSRG